MNTRIVLATCAICIACPALADQAQTDLASALASASAAAQQNQMQQQMLQQQSAQQNQRFFLWNRRNTAIL